MCISDFAVCPASSLGLQNLLEQHLMLVIEAQKESEPCEPLVSPPSSWGGRSHSCSTFSEFWGLTQSTDFWGFQGKPTLPEEASAELPFKSVFKSFIGLDQMIIKTNALD